MASLLAAHKYARLSAKKDLNVDEEKKKQVKDLRDTEKYIWKELEEHYFSQSEEHILEALKYCRKPMEGLARITLQFKAAFAGKKTRKKCILVFRYGTLCPGNTDEKRRQKISFQVLLRKNYLPDMRK